MEIRRLSREDARLAFDALCAIAWCDRPDVPRPPQYLIARWLARSENVLCVALESGQPVGLCLAYVLDRPDGRPMLWVHEIEVLAAHRRCGVGRLLLAAIERVERETGAAKAWVITESNNRAARALYGSCGWAEQEPSTLFARGRNALPEVNE